MTIRWLPLAVAVACFVSANAGDVVLHGAEPQASVAVAEAAARIVRFCNSTASLVTTTVLARAV